VSSLPVTPAKAGVQGDRSEFAALDSRIRGNDKGEATLPLDWPIDVALTVASHGWVQLAPWSWDAETGRLGRAERIDNRIGAIWVAQHGPQTLAIGWSRLAGIPAGSIAARVRRWLSADWDPAPAAEVLGAEAAALIARGGGRLLRCSTFYEDFAKTLLTVNTSWSGTLRMTAALVAEPGGGAFPEPAAILDYGEVRLRERAKLGFRAPTLVATTARMLADGAIDAAGNGTDARLDHDYLIGLKGIGPYAAAHCRLLLQDFSRIPVDSVVTAYLRQRHDTDPSSFATSRADWGPYLALGYRLGRLQERLAALSEPDGR
jgi:3-methyladenine DNA glycosylase/8-oxoguanine DNA glycosylase